MENVERKILIPEEFYLLPEDQQEPISNEMFQYLWGWKNNKHDKPISVNGEVYWIIQSPPPNRTTFHLSNEEQVAVWDDIVYCQQHFTRPIGVAEFHLHTKYRKKVNVERIAHEICCEWSQHRVADANRRIEEWKVRRKEIFVEHFGKDMPYHDPFEKESA